MKSTNAAFTLVIPSHNRHQHLKRSISYFSSLNAHVLICDSSLEPLRQPLSDNMQLLHVPNLGFADKILYALEKTDTPFVALCADDDFILIETLNKGVELLEDSNEYSVVLGRNIAFHEEFDGCFYSEMKSTSRDIASTPASNAANFFSNYHQILWGLYSKEVLKKSFELIKKANYRNDNFIELTLGAVACYTGGIRILDDVWSVRELSAKQHWGDKQKPITYIYQEKIIQKDFKLFKQLIDKVTQSGYADLILSSYVNISRYEKSKMYIKYFLKKIGIKKGYDLLLAKSKQKQFKNSAEKYQAANLIKVNDISSLSAIIGILDRQ